MSLVEYELLALNEICDDKCKFVWFSDGRETISRLDVLHRVKGFMTIRDRDFLIIGEANRPEYFYSIDSANMYKVVPQGYRASLSVKRRSSYDGGPKAKRHRYDKMPDIM